MEPKDSNRESNAERVSRLEGYLAQGYLLHGSKNKHAVIEPRQATDEDEGRTTGKANAIYAEKHDIRIPIVMALFDKKDPTQRSSGTSYHTSGPGTLMEVSGVNYTFTTGYVHVLPSDSFELEGDENDNEYISRSPITPIDIIEVDPSILSELPMLSIDPG